MAELHKYQCIRCRFEFLATTAGHLAGQVNQHILAMHPADFSNWTPGGIILSAHYSGPKESAALPQYTKPYADRNITDEDKKFLALVRVKW
jgi:hypothetical protein